MWYKEHIQSRVSLLVLCAFSWAACPGMWEGKVRSALACVECCGATSQVSSAVNSICLCFFFPKLASKNIKIVIPCLLPSYTAQPAGCFCLGNVPTEGIGFKNKNFAFPLCPGQLCDSKWYSDFNGETKKQLNKKQWDRTQKGTL